MKSLTISQNISTANGVICILMQIGNAINTSKIKNTITKVHNLHNEWALLIFTY